MKMYGVALKGSLWTVIACFPMAIIVGVIYRVPIPLGGYVGGIRIIQLSIVKEIMVAVILYGVMGGFAVLAILGAIGGWIAYRVGNPDPNKIARLNIAIALALAFSCVMVLSLLDKMIGPW